MSDVMEPDDLSKYAERRAIFLALEKARDEGTGLLMHRQIVAHLTEVEPVQVAMVFYHVAERADGGWPVSEVGTFFHPREIEEHLAEAWGPWVG